jgi:1-deoxyxylulose-5-phosphate synthase
VARPWGEQDSARAQANPDVDMHGRPLVYDTDKAIVDAVQRVAEDRSVSMAQVAMAWVLRNPVVSAPILGATKPEHLTDAAAALDLHLTADEIDAVEKPYTPREPTYF